MKKKFKIKKKIFLFLALTTLLILFGTVIVLRYLESSRINKVRAICIDKTNDVLATLTGVNYTGNSFIYDNANGTFDCYKTGNLGKDNSLYALDMSYIDDEHYDFEKEVFIESKESYKTELKFDEDSKIFIQKYLDGSAYSILSVKDNVEISATIGSAAFNGVDDSKVVESLERFVDSLPHRQLSNVNNSFLRSVPYFTGKSRFSLKRENHSQVFVTNGDNDFYTINSNWE